MNKSSLSTKIPDAEVKNFYPWFKDFPYFKNYINYAFNFLQPELFTDGKKQPETMAFYTKPAWFLAGNPELVDTDTFLNNMKNNSWILSANPEWETVLKNFFGTSLIEHPRQAFDSTHLSLPKMQELKKLLSDDLVIKRVGTEEVLISENMLSRDIVNEYFKGQDYLAQGVGFCIMDGDKMVAFASANYPLNSQILEIYVRVEDSDKYRKKGLGTAVSAALIEYCLQNNLDPHWDAANETSTKLALKLGYLKTRSWSMYQLKSAVN